MSQVSPAPKAKLELSALTNFIAVAYVISLPLSMTVAWALLIVGITLCTIELFKTGFEGRARLLQHMPLKLPLLIFGVAVALSSLIVGGIKEAGLAVLSLKGILAYVFASQVFSRDVASLRKIGLRQSLASTCIAGLLYVSTVAGIWGTIQQVFNIHPGYRYLQGTGFLSGPMAFAGQMQLFSMLALSLLITQGHRKLPFGLANKAVFAVVTLANLSGLIFAGERSAWLGGIAAVLVIASCISVRALGKAVAVLLVLGTISWFTVPLVHTRIESMLAGQQDVSTRVRFTIWQRAIKEWQSAPVTGIGLLKFPHLDFPEAIVPGRSKDLNHAHSNYLHIASTLGVMGLGAYIVLLAAALLSSRKLQVQGKQTNNALIAGIGLGLIAGLVSLSVSGLFEYNFGSAQVRLAQWFLLGFLGLLATSDDRQDII